AVVLRPSTAKPSGCSVADVVSLTDTTTADHMTWHVTDLGFRMGLSPQVPEVLSHHVGPLISGMLDRNGLNTSDIAAWALHPGGPRILDVVRDELGLTNDDLEASRAVLAEHGNCSSPTVLMILDRIRRREDGPVVAMAFGPGLTLYASLLRPERA